jgi:hypothetical protein
MVVMVDLVLVVEEEVLEQQVESVDEVVTV